MQVARLPSTPSTRNILARIIYALSTYLSYPALCRYLPVYERQRYECGELEVLLPQPGPDVLRPLLRPQQVRAVAGGVVEAGVVEGGENVAESLGVVSVQLLQLDEDVLADLRGHGGG